MSRNVTEEEEQVAIRFWSSLILQDSISEMPLAELAGKYNLSTGTIQSLMTSCKFSF